MTDQEAFELIFACNKIHTKEQLKALQSLTLEQKIQATKIRIIEWYNHYDGKVYVSFSGGKDSTVLLNIVRQCYSNVPAVYVDTGLEYPEIRDFVKTIDNVTWLKPKMNFREVLKKYGYPVISKEISNVVHGAKKDTNNVRYQRLQGTLINPKTGKLSNFNCPKYKYLLDAPFKISDQCCTYMKKQPALQYDKETGSKPYLGLMTEESSKREQGWLKTGCNAFDKGKPQSQPMAFWTEQNVLEYIKKYNIPYSKIYGNIILNKDNKYETTGEKRTGCMFCMFGCHLEKEPNRFQRMKITHPKQYDYCINNLGLGEVLDFIGVKY